ncbi:hypothetical protein HK098_007166 [Nowakowskiella sp. JEL0407]|nr:hypothetical protein HK098_007166 [Nowakowskiella sp. JEL0407]
MPAPKDDENSISHLETDDYAIAMLQNKLDEMEVTHQLHFEQHLDQLLNEKKENQKQFKELCECVTQLKANRGINVHSLVVKLGFDNNALETKFDTALDFESIAEDAIIDYQEAFNQQHSCVKKLLKLAKDYYPQSNPPIYRYYTNKNDGSYCVNLKVLGFDHMSLECYSRLFGSAVEAAEDAADLLITILKAYHDSLKQKANVSPSIQFSGPAKLALADCDSEKKSTSANNIILQMKEVNSTATTSVINAGDSIFEQATWPSTYPQALNKLPLKY